MWRPWIGKSSVEQLEGVQVQPQRGNENKIRRLFLDATANTKNVYAKLIECEKLSKMACVELLNPLFI